MDAKRLQWQPEGLDAFETMSRKISAYLSHRKRFALFENGTFLVIKEVPDLHRVIKGSMDEAKRLTDFTVCEMMAGDHVVRFATPLWVYVSQAEFACREAEIRARMADLKFSNEVLQAPDNTTEREMLVGLYARGKLHRDIFHARRYRVVDAPALFADSPPAQQGTP